ncbi:hypothetical protein NON00_12985 [Roseomonas sp. GC11]|uniref:hypothetical protein n=1 Tax=Roseomonas sp. GC11 TaxID=2950546 RepID=UPI00210BC89D|nr:hypothetical protein [Roseomonas sp. GC11]MCQ4160843.1 hypothetical protein [Roseomonas sp. GC11]
MGEAKLKQYNRQQFLREHPTCCYCGAVATTTDHCPPRALFQNRHWPEGYEFPCCQPCNAAGRQSEQVAVAILRPSLFQETEDEAWEKTVRSLKINRPEVLDEWTEASRNQMRRMFREKFGDGLGDYLRNQGYGIVELGPISQAAIEEVLFRLGQALFYKHVGRRCAGGKIWIVRMDMLNAEGSLDSITKITPLLAQSVRGRIDLSDQFLYRYNVSPSEGILCAVVKIREQFGAVVTVMEQPHANTFAAMPNSQKMVMRDCPP